MIFSLVSMKRGPLQGLRMSADEYFQIGETRERYELIDGVVVMSSSPTPLHQEIALLIATEIRAFIKNRPVARVFHELDVYLGRGLTGGDLVYRPDIMVFRHDRLKALPPKLRIAPGLVIEIISEHSRQMDLETKKTDFERFGVEEYWVIDPDEKKLTFYRLIEGKYVEVISSSHCHTSSVIAGFMLDLNLVRTAFENK